MSLGTAIFLACLVLLVLGIYAVMRVGDRRHDWSHQDVLAECAERERAYVEHRASGRWGIDQLRQDPNPDVATLWQDLTRGDRFPAPRVTDCEYGCCKAGDVGIGSEVVRTSVHGRFPLDPNAPEPPNAPDLSEKAMREKMGDAWVDERLVWHRD